jgi:5-methylcytosine-specific restriction protein A
MNTQSTRFLKGVQLTRNEIWQYFHPNQGDKPKGGNWDTGYVVEGDELVAFLNIGAAGRTGHDFDNAYDTESETITWFGKPNTHSQQPLFKKLIDEKLTPHFFARWDSNNTKFTYLGEGKIISFEDNIPIENDKTTIRFKISLTTDKETIGSQGLISSDEIKPPEFGKKVSMIVNKWERDPSKRRECLEHYGFDCQICGFSFEKIYGDIGKQFIHVHHIEPLYEVGGENKNLDPIKDLIPVCPNCHEMIHRSKISLKPDELRKIISKKFTN